MPLSIKKNLSFFDLDNSSHTYTLIYSYMCSYLKGPGIRDIVGYNGPVIAAPILCYSESTYIHVHRVPLSLLFLVGDIAAVASSR